MPDNYYFPHDYNAIQDPKMMVLLRNCGMAGIGFYWTIIEILHQQPKGKITVEAFDDYLNFYLGFENKGSEYIASVKKTLHKTKLLKYSEYFVWSTRAKSNQQKRKEIAKLRASAGRIGGLNKYKTEKELANAKQNIANAKHEMKGNKKKININTDDKSFSKQPTPKTIKMADELKARAYALMASHAVAN